MSLNKKWVKRKEKLFWLVFFTSYNIMFRTAPIIRDPTPAKTIRPGIVNNFFVPRALVDGIIRDEKPVVQKAVPTVERVRPFATRGDIGTRRIPG